jgi:DNA-binding transcriptional MerR regulator
LTLESPPTLRLLLGDASKGGTGMGEKQFFIGTLAKTAGLTPDTVRYYEAIGVMPEPERSRSGYRVYVSAAVERLEFIGQAQALGLTLEEIREILALTDGGAEPCDHVRDRLRQRLLEVQRRINELRALRGRLRAALREAEESSEAEGCRCQIIEGAAGEHIVRIGLPERGAKL